MHQTPMKTDITITAGESPKRLDVFLANHEPTLSRSALQRLILDGRITMNGRSVRPSQKIRPGDRIELDIPRDEPLELQPAAIPFDILYEEYVLLFLDKPVGLVVHPAPGHGTGTLVNALLHHFQHSGGLSTIGGQKRPRVLDRAERQE